MRNTREHRSIERKSPYEWGLLFIIWAAVIVFMLITIFSKAEYVYSEDTTLNVGASIAKPECVEEVVETTVVEVVEEEVIPEVTNNSNTTLTSLGFYELTAYCPCMQCCGKTDGITATGVKATPNHTIAVDPRDIPYGTHVMINGIEYVAEDCGGAIKGKRIDIYFDSHTEALQFGRQKNIEVFLVQ